jgi:hypothetical protein
MDILGSVRLDVEVAASDRKCLLDQQVADLNLGLFVASFAYQAPKESLRAAS